MKVYLCNRDITPRIVMLGTIWTWVVSFMPRPLYTRRNSRRYPFERRLCWPRIDLDTEVKKEKISQEIST